jgi:tRNA G18 (ribose-2'-O)-methylase SpoU
MTPAASADRSAERWHLFDQLGSKSPPDPAANRSIGVSGEGRLTTDELVASRPSPCEREADRLPLIIALDNVRSAFNVGLIFRLADCVGIEAIWLSGITAYPGVTERATNRLAKTAVGGSLDVMPWFYFSDVTGALAEQRRAGYRIVAFEQTQTSVPWGRGDLSGPAVFIFGHEREGIRSDLLALADQTLALPMRGITNSLNVALCASAVLYASLGRSEHGAAAY